MLATPAAAPPRRATARRDAHPAAWGLAAWVAVVALALVWGTLAVADAGVSLRAAPLYGRWDWRAGRGLLPAVVLAGATVAWGPSLAARLPWRAVPPLAGLAAAAWTVALAAADGWSRLTAPLIRDHEYEPLAAGIDDIGAFLRTFSERLPDYPIHVQGHPPGPVVLAWLADRVGLGGAGWLAAVAIAGWAAAAVAALVAARALAGEGAARRAAPALAVLPAAVWAGTSLDGLFAGLGAVGLGLVAVALRRNRDGTGRRTPVPVALSGGAGVALGVALLCSYGAALLVVMAAAIVAVVAPEPARLLGPLAAGVLAPLALAAAAGFSWPDGLAATSDAYWAGVAGDRPAAYVTLAGNPGALGLAAGPAVAAGLAATLASPADRRARLLPAAALAAVVVANLSQMSRGEVERIWLPFVPWLALAAPGNRRGWLAAQAGLALVLQAALVASW